MRKWKKLLSPLFFGLTSNIFFLITGGSRKYIVNNQENSFSAHGHTKIAVL